MKFGITHEPGINTYLIVKTASDGFTIYLYHVIDFINFDEHEVPDFSYSYSDIQRSPCGKRAIRLINSRTFTADYFASQRHELDVLSSVYVCRGGGLDGDLLFDLPKLKESYLGKEGGVRFISRKGIHVPLQFMLPFRDSPTSDWLYRATVNKDIGYHIDAHEELEIVEVENSHEGFTDFATPRRFGIDMTAARQPDGSYLLNISVPELLAFARTPSEKRVFLKTNGGFLPRTEVLLDENYTASAKWLPLGLDAGETATVEVGFKFYTNVNRVEVQA